MDGGKKQEVVVADQKSTAKITLWEDQIGSLKQGQLYCLQAFFVKEFGGEEYLSVGSELKIVPIENVEVLEISNTDKTIKDVAIMSVAQLNCYRAYLRCNVRVEETANVPDQTAACCRGWSFAVNMLTLMFAENRFEPLTVYGKVLYDLLEITHDTEVAENMFLHLPNWTK